MFNMACFCGSHLERRGGEIYSSSQWAFLFSTTTYSFAFKQRNTPGAYLPADVRFCLSFHERFYYDSVDNQCKTYSWGGCLGNANYFAAADDCLASCA